MKRKSDVTTDLSPAAHCKSVHPFGHLRGLMVYPSSMALTTAIDSDTPVSSGAGRTSQAD
jgi:hypothetical protein